MRESDLQSRCMAWLRQHYPDVVAVNVHGGGWSAKGCPDILCCVHGRFIAFELKVGDNHQAVAQRIWQTRIERAGGRVYVPYTLEDFKGAVEREYEAGQSV